MALLHDFQHLRGSEPLIWKTLRKMPESFIEFVSFIVGIAHCLLRLDGILHP